MYVDRLNLAVSKRTFESVEYYPASALDAHAAVHAPVRPQRLPDLRTSSTNSIGRRIRHHSHTPSGYRQLEPQNANKSCISSSNGP
jgi:hypothetical protein